MQKTLVLMRHAKAKRPVDGQPDMERPLSEAGKRSLRATLPQALGLWQSGKDRVEIWSSPATRATQTAVLLAKALGKHGVKTGNEILQKDFLWSASLPSLSQELCETQADTVVIVGHNPTIEDWVHFLTGSRIIFATGAMAAISLDVEELAQRMANGSAPSGADDDDIDIARLLWFSQGPISQRWKTLVTMEGIISDASETVGERLEQFFEDPDDIETMHKLRVSIRTLRSLVAFVKPWQDPDQNAKAQADLRAVVGITSHLRELDVLAEQAEAAPQRSNDLVVFCKRCAADERAAVMDALSDKRTRKRLQRVCADLEQVRWKPRYNKEGLEAAQVRAHFDDMADSLRDDLQSLDFAEVERTHDVRKQAKRVRYSAERFKEILGNDAVDVAKNMTAHQDNLGAICDARVNIDIINSFALEDLPEPVAWDLALLRAENETFLYTTLRDSH